MSWWTQRQRRDRFVRDRQSMNYRSRAAFKLKELIERCRLSKRRGPFVDLGAAPGGWCQILQEVYPDQQIFGCDLLAMDPIEGVEFLQADFLSSDFEQFLQQHHVQTVGGIVSDIAPNLSGQALVEQAQMLAISQQMRLFAEKFLHPKGFIIQKLFHGHAFDEILQQWKACYTDLRVVKPEASRSESAEVYLFIQHKH